MLQKTDFEFEIEEQDRSHLLRPGFYWDLVKRRWLAFLGPFVIVAAAGIAAAMLWPATYLAEGKILGDTTTLADATIVDRLKRQYEEREEA